VNGTIEAREGGAPPFPYDQPRKLFRNVGGGRFEEVTKQAGAAFEGSEVGRGAAFGDLNNDGATDVIVANGHGRARVLINRRGSRNHWLGLRLVGGATNPRDMVGARVGVTRADGSVLWRRAHSDGSYASANDPRVIVGLGTTAGPVRANVVWPGGRSEEWADLPVDGWTTLREGSRP
jgi:enediyne biosynthesis protein E4